MSPGFTTCTPSHATLLALPNELLARIAWALAPDGGRQAGLLRLACQGTNLAVAHVVWSLVSIRAGGAHHDELWAELLLNELGNTAAVRGLRYELGVESEVAPLSLQIAVLRQLKGLTRLEVAGAMENVGPIIEGTPLPRKISQALRHFDALESIIFRQIDFIGDRNSETWLPPNLRVLEMDECSGLDEVFQRFTEVDSWVPARMPVQMKVGKTHGRRHATTGLLALYSVATSCHAASVYLFMPSAGAAVALIDAMEAIPANQLRVRTLRIAGLHSVFRVPDVAGVNIVLRLQSVFAQGPLSTLTLPVYDNFHVPPALLDLRLPNIRILELAAFPDSAYSNHRDLYSSSTHGNLLTFVATVFPRIVTLQLTGWFDRTGVSLLAECSPQQLATTFPEVAALLTFLRWQEVVELRLVDSPGRPNKSECFFARESSAAADWVVRVPVY